MDRPWGFQEVEAPRFQDSRHMKVVRFSALRTGCLYPLSNIPGTHSWLRLSRPQGHSAAGRITSMKNPNDTIGNWTATFRFVAQCLKYVGCTLFESLLLWSSFNGGHYSFLVLTFQFTISSHTRQTSSLNKLQTNLLLSGLVTAVAVFRNPNTIPFCLIL